MARSVYSTRYSLEKQSAFGTAVTNLSKGIQDSADAASNITVSKSGILLNDNTTDIEPGVNIIDTRKSAGSASRRAGTGAEYQQGTRAPSTTWGFDVSTRVIYPFLETFFQDGRVVRASGGSTAEAKWYVPHSYTSGIINSSNGEAMTIVQDLGGSNSKKVQDVITSQLELTANDDDNKMTASATLMGGSMDVSYDASGDDFNYASIAPLLFQNSNGFIGNTEDALEPATFPGFSLTLNNNAVGKHYNSEYITRFQLGDFTGSGTVSPPWTLGTTNFEDNTLISRFINGNVTRIVFAWGATTTPSSLDDLDTDNDMTIALLVRYTGATVTGEDELMNEMPFDLVEAPTFSKDYAVGSTTNITTATASGAVITLGFSDNGTAVGNIYPGDRAVVDGTNYLISAVDWGTPSVTLYDDTAGAAYSGGDPNNMTIYGAPINVGIYDSQKDR